ncbi:Bug family tripartite tricarboxylate transporter substrate binding protein [Cupriavidus oxalaticus]|nr:tripartite tricarboxylate transporter substrate binding protein [Cupriavidus oxalaticus]
MMELPFEPGRRMLLLGAAGCALGAALPSAGIGAEPAYPARPVRLVVPFSSGSGTDVLARVYARIVGELAGQPFVVENRGGANGVIGAKAVLGAPCDGYTVLFASATVLATNAALYRQPPYDPLADFTPVTVLDGGYCVVAVPASSSWKSMAALAAEAKRRPGALNHGAGTPTYAMWSAWLNEILGIDTANIVYKGSGDALNAVVSGQVDYAILSGGVADAMIRAGRLRALMVTDNKRSPMFPGVPAAPEAGASGFRAFAWTGVAVRSGTPEDIVRTLTTLFMRAAEHPDVRSSLAKLGYVPMVTGPAGMRKFQQEEIERSRRLVAAAGIAVE